MSILIRPETAADLDAIRHVNRLAFGQEDETGRPCTLQWACNGRVDEAGRLSTQDVADELTLDLGHQRGPHESAFTKRIDQPRNWRKE
jgi:hypothetical protein